MATPFVVHFHPVAFSIGPVHVHWYGLMYLGGFLGGWALGEYRRRQGRLPVSADRFGDLNFALLSDKTKVVDQKGVDAPIVLPGLPAAAVS